MRCEENLDLVEPKKKLRTCYLCDGCNEPIHDVSKGFIVQGNIYVADSKCRNGLIGNNITDDGQVLETVFCINCFKEALDI